MDNTIYKFVSYLDVCIDKIYDELSREILDVMTSANDKTIRSHLFDSIKKEIINYFSNPEFISMEDIFESHLRLVKINNNFDEKIGDTMKYLDDVTKELKYEIYQYFYDNSDKKTKYKISQINCYKSYINILTNKNTKGKIFVQKDFKFISSILFKNTNLNTMEQFKILISYIESDLNLLSVDEESMTFEINCYGIMQEKDNKLVEICINSEMVELVKSINEVRKHYINKNDNFDTNDIEIVVNNLKKLCVDDILCEKIRYVLEKEIAKRNKGNLSCNIKFETEEDRREIEKTKRKMQKELKTYINVKNMKPLRILSMNDILYVGSLLKKLNYSVEIIHNFFKQCETMIIEQNPIFAYIQLYDKLKYYAERYCLLNELDESEQYFNELFLSSAEDYTIYKDFIKEKLSQILDFVPKTYEYEMKKVLEMI